MATTATVPQFLTVGQAALALKCREWQIDRLYRLRKLPEPGRLGRLRAINAADLPRIRAALVAAGYLAAPDDGR
jgi:hypothetical protein